MAAFATFDPHINGCCGKVKGALSTSPKLPLSTAGWLGSANAPQRCGQLSSMQQRRRTKQMVRLSVVALLAAADYTGSASHSSSVHRDAMLSVNLDDIVSARPSGPRERASSDDAPSAARDLDAPQANELQKSMDDWVREQQRVLPRKDEHERQRQHADANASASDAILSQPLPPTQPGVQAPADEQLEDTSARSKLRRGRRKRKHAGAADGADDPSDWFGDWWSSGTAKRDIREALASNQPVHIKRFLREEKAALLHAELYASTRFVNFTMAVPNYQFQYSALYPTTASHAAEWEWHPVAKQLYDVLNSQAVKSWVERVGGCSVGGTTEVSMTHYRPGDYTMAHTDTGTGHNPKDPSRRRVAFVLHMAKDWDPKHGGDLIFMNPPTFIAASFNAMTFFPVSKAAWHLVSPVAVSAPPSSKRLAFSGWWMTQEVGKAKAIENNHDDSDEARSFIKHVDGSTGQLLKSRRSIQPD